MNTLPPVQLIDALDKRWLSFTQSRPEANIFHHPAWVSLLAECYGYRPFVLASFDPLGGVCAGMPFLAINSPLTGRRWVSLPFTDFCPPLARDPVSLEGLSQALTEELRAARVPRIEVRWNLPPHAAIQTNSGYVMHTLRLDRDAGKLTANFHRTQRQNIHTAEKNGVEVIWGQERQDVREFYRLHCLTRRRQGVPVQPWRFFDLVWQRLIAEDLGFVLLARAGRETLAAGLFLHWQKALSYKYAASSESGQNLRPNHLLTWTAIRWGCENGLGTFDFGRTEASNEGLRTYKNRWGVLETPLTYSSLLAGVSGKPGTGRFGGWMQALIRKSPVAVCRLAGELLYRHFG